MLCRCRDACKSAIVRATWRSRTAPTRAARHARRRESKPEDRSHRRQEPARGAFRGLAHELRFTPLFELGSSRGKDATNGLGDFGASLEQAFEAFPLHDEEPRVGLCPYRRRTRLAGEKRHLSEKSRRVHVGDVLQAAASKLGDDL